MKPEELLYAKTHEWVYLTEEAGTKVATVGISAFAVEALTDLVYLAVPKGTGRRWHRSLKNNTALCRRLGLGLVTMSDPYVNSASDSIRFPWFDFSTTAQNRSIWYLDVNFSY